MCIETYIDFITNPLQTSIFKDCRFPLSAPFIYFRRVQESSAGCSKPTKLKYPGQKLVSRGFLIDLTFPMPVYIEMYMVLLHYITGPSKWGALQQSTMLGRLIFGNLMMYQFILTG